MFEFFKKFTKKVDIKVKLIKGGYDGFKCRK